jgi:hypothetical protein
VEKRFLEASVKDTSAVRVSREDVVADGAESQPRGRAGEVKASI